MSIGLVLCALVVVTGASAVVLRWILRNRRRVRRLERAETSVAEAVADGRLSRATGEALMQHLEGLRRECTGSNGS